MIYPKPVKKTPEEKKKAQWEKAKAKRLVAYKELKSKRKIYSEKKEIVKKLKPKSHNASWYRKHCDTVFSKIIRTRDGRCMHCGGTENLQCSHTMSRKIWALRWNEMNCITLCFFCHMKWWHINVLEAAKWFEETFPVNFLYLQEHKNDILKLTVPDYITLYENLKTRLKELECTK